MRTNTYLLILLLVLNVACSSDDADLDTEETQIKPIRIQAIGGDNEAIYQYSNDGSQDIGETTNLSTELGLGSQYLTLRQVGNTLSFYTFNQGKFSLRQKDVSTGAVETYIDFYTNTTARSIVWGTNNEETVFFGYYNPQGTTNLAIQNVALDNLEGSDLSLEFNIEQLYQPLYHDGKLYITYKDSTLEYKISVYDTTTFALIQTLEYGTTSPSILIDVNGDLAIFKFGNTPTVRLEYRDVNTLGIFKEQDFELNQRFLPGPMNAELKDGKLYYGYEYSQPFELLVGPAVLDIATGENQPLDLIGVINEVETTEEISTYVVWQQYNAIQDVFFVSYGTYGLGSNLTGGILVLSPDGTLLKNVNLPFVPSYFVK